MLDQTQAILDNKNPIVNISDQSKLKEKLYYKYKVVRNQSGRLVLRNDLTLRYRVQTKQTAINVIWHGGEEAPRMAT